MGSSPTSTTPTLFPTTGDEDGYEYDTLASVYAERGNERRLIRDVAAKALGLKPDDAFWYVDAPIALKRLREIAGR
ncbi:hypothetical protein [Streptomyces flaveus]|uniref:hypothetical protein n=1 Tax=Streptomyces flaveus TaxID=66370 RepID=UPI00332D3B23